ncbi:MAG: LPS-assembly protein LptD [Pigmentiphaga sp.]|uniref:LPS-assembly protein LptD n=1 Tax=Pigmentiphaga sp. TaxID=1977564 RepID=UPI003B55FA40
MRLIRWFSLFAAFAVAPLAYAQDGPSESPAGAGPVSGPGLRLSPGLREHTYDPDQLPVFMQADTLTAEDQDKLRLEGNAQVRRQDIILKGDAIEYDQVEDELGALGNVRLIRDGNLLTGPRLKLNMSSGTGEIDNARFFFGLNGGSGSAERIRMLGQNRVRADRVRYSGCACETPDWELRARRADFDYDAGTGVGYGGVLYFKNVPILASPIISFPLNNERKSGFLSPTFGLTSKSGPEFSIPYYFNIAPNRDATLTPKFMTRRGLQLSGEFRYLEPSFSGVTRLSYLPDDRVAQRDRYLFSSQHRQQLTPNLGFNWNVSKASDDAYFRDLSVLGTGLASTATLERSFSLNWQQGYWEAYGRVISYQTLQDPLAPIVPPYGREPQLHLTGQRYDWNGFDVRMDADATRFRSNTLVNGSRAYAYPSVSYPIIRPGGFFIPKIGIHSTRYNTDSYQGAASYTANRTVPIMSLDTGLIFERDSTLLGKEARQTLEPRLYYLRVPYRNQSNLPIYDTALADFNFAQIFSENLYSGWDRIAEANQLTAALTTRWLDPKTGVERARIMGAQRLYFSDQRVTLPGEEPSSDGRSDFLVSVYGALTSTLSGETTVQYNPKIERVTRSTIGARWSPQRLSTISLAYRYKRETISVPGQELIDIAFQWPLAPRWFGIGRINYSLLENRIAEAVAGIEYNGGCCWAFRLVGQRYAVAKDNATTAMFFQLELTGFGGIGASPMTTLRRSIPGYQVINPPPEKGTVFERYE